MMTAYRLLIGSVLALVFSAFFPAVVHAQKVAVLHADPGSRADDVRAKLIAAGLTDVTMIDVADMPGRPAPAVPTLDELLHYDVILTWSNYPYVDAAAIGDRLADYVDNGGGVAQAIFSFEPSAPTRLDGRWHAHGYGLFTHSTALIDFGLTPVPVLPDHPILLNAAFDPGPASYYNPSMLSGPGDEIARWSNGYPLVAARQGPLGGNIVGLNLYPSLGQAGGLLANALRFAARTTPYVDGPSVALLAADDHARVADVRGKLQSLKLFSRVDVIDAAAAVPPLDALLQYDAVFTWSNLPYGAPSALGDVLADYVDQNRGVVQAGLGFDPGPGLGLGGRWSSGGYRPFSEGPTMPPPPSPLTMVPVMAGHALLDGILSFSGGASSVHAMVTLEGAAHLVASWSDGQPLVAFGTQASGGRLVGLNLYPASSAVRADLWDASTDGAQLIANALLFAANHFPTADAGADRSVEALSPAPVIFALDAVASDLDGDDLTYTWSGAGSATGTSVLVDVPPPPAPHKSHTVTVVLTVSDGKGGEATDSVALTVTDTTPPVLINMPTGIVKAEATSAGGANVSYGPVTATDAVDGAVPVVCSHSGMFPIGETLVSCSASDTRGNAVQGNFIVSVVDPGVPGKMHGAGFLVVGDVRYGFAFAVRENASKREQAVLLVRAKQDQFVGTTVSEVMFGGNSVVFRGTGSHNGVPGHLYEVLAVDNGEPGTADYVRITMTSPSGTVRVLSGVVIGGNVQTFKLPTRN